MKKKLSEDMLLNSGVTILQDKSLYSFNLDTALLTNFVNSPQTGTIIDMCAGNGAIGLTLTSYTQADVILYDLQSELLDLANKSISLNHLDQQVSVINDDVANFGQHFEHDSIDMMVCNPPYFDLGASSKPKQNPVVAKARHEINFDLADAFKCAHVLLKENSKLFMVYRPDRLQMFLDKMSEFTLKLNRIQFVQTRKTDSANLMLVEISKTAKRGGTVVEPPIIMYEENSNELTQEAKDILNGQARR